MLEHSERVLESQTRAALGDWKGTQTLDLHLPCRGRARGEIGEARNKTGARGLDKPPAA